MIMYFNNRKLALSIFWIILGAVLLGLSITEVIDSSLYAGMGGALIAVGVLQCIRNIRYRKDADYRENIDTEMKDERNRYLRMMSWSWAGYLVVLLESVGVIIAMVTGHETVQLVLAYSVCLILICYWVSYMILKRKY